MLRRGDWGCPADQTTGRAIEQVYTAAPPADRHKVTVPARPPRPSLSAACGELLPLRSFPTLVGRPKVRSTMVGADCKDLYVGREAQVVVCLPPVEGGRRVDRVGLE